LSQEVFDVRKALTILGMILAVIVVAVAGFYAWASWLTSRTFAQTVASHTVDFPVPFPLPQSEMDSLGLDSAAAAAVAQQRAIERGRHLVEARYACVECHGPGFGGGVMIDAPPIGRMLGPNLTGGVGSRTASFTPADWDRIVRHGILPGGRPSVMPAQDFREMSDQELSDIITYVRARPRVDSAVAPRSFGPVGKLLVATGKFVPPATVIGPHDAPHPTMPPPAAVTLEFGRHLAATCVGCHGQDLAGGPIVGGDPSWVPARNLTPHVTGLADWTYAQFATAMRDGRRPDGTALRAPMTFVQPFAQQMSDVELEATWMYLQSLPAMEGR
jgi:mono/diheme cytochrome c family protein